jgi:membrane-associated phospholipid phosphatase
LALEEIREELDSLVPEFDEAGSPQETADLQNVRELTVGAMDPAFFQANENLSKFLSDSSYILRPLPAGSTSASPTPIYPPPGAVYNRRSPIDQPFLRNGAELARLFESETPGLWHRHVLNIILDPTVVNGCGQRLSAPRQALIWAALDVAISSALQAAWYLKWYNLDGRRKSFRRRPWEADNGLSVLFDHELAYDPVGNITLGNLRTDPPGTGVVMTAGTPRHPAYPSGHSTYSAAASVVLGCLLPEYRASFHLLANNIGRARLWAGVHWFQDHIIGQLVGKRIAELILAQIGASGIERMPAPTSQVPGDTELRSEEVAYYGRARTNQDFCAGICVPIPPPAAAPSLMNSGPVFMSPAARSPLPPADLVGELDVG